MDAKPTVDIRLSIYIMKTSEALKVPAIVVIQRCPMD